jgi:hypothetical protein
VLNCNRLLVGGEVVLAFDEELDCDDASVLPSISRDRVWEVAGMFVLCVNPYVSQQHHTPAASETLACLQ